MTDEDRVHEVLFELAGFCIETRAKKIYHKLMENVLNMENPADGEMQAIELLREFLKQEDFAQIRANDPEMTGAYAIQVRVFRDASGKVRWHKWSGE